MRSSHVSGRKKLLRCALLLLTAWTMWMVARTAILLHHSDQIAQRSANFPHNYFVGGSSSQPLTYLILGDSTAAGWGAQNVRGSFAYQVAQALAARGFRVHVVNVAVGGARLQDVLRHQIASLKTVQPQLITISIGANDATHNTGAIEYSNELKQLFTALQKSTAKTIVVANTPDLSRDPALPWLLAQVSNNRAQHQNVLFNEALQEANKHGTTIRAVDLYRDGKLVHRRDDDQYAEDLFHPSGSGYGVWARLFIAQLNLNSWRPPQR